MVDKFMMDLRDYTASVSSCVAPAGIILFGVSEPFLKKKRVLVLHYFPSINPIVLVLLQFALLMLGMD